jgi:hypothetical protein
MLLVAIAGCSAPTTGVPTASRVRYYRDVKPILEAKCVSCHAPGAFAASSFTTAADAAKYRAAMKLETSARRMPPWPPSNGCASYQGDRSLSDAQVATLAAWGDSQGEPGSEADFKPLAVAPPLKLSRTDLTIAMPQAYTPVLSPDEYRCFLMDWPLTTDTHITGFSVDPGVVAIVHHTLVYIVPPDQVAAYQSLDDAEAGPGYSCFAGPNKGLEQFPLQVGAWVPGTFGVDYPAGTGIKVAAGSKLVVQMHYNTAFAKPVADTTSVRVKVDATVEKEAFIMPFTNPSWVKLRTMPIDAGAPDTMYDFAFDATTAVALRTKGAIASNRPFTIYTAALHQHLHGTHSTLEVVKANGTKQCLLDIPAWDFHWQGSYALTTPRVVNPGDSLRIECHWDNSDARQPLGPDGRPAMPQPLNWGEGTNDEMCIGFMLLTQ